VRTILLRTPVSTVLLRGGVLALGVAVIAPFAAAQSPRSPEARTKAITASFNKFKNVSKEKRGVRKDKYIKVQSAPVVLANPGNYSGKYDVPDFNFGMDLRVSRDGTFTGNGYEALDENVRRTFTFRNGKIEGALLTATKVYSNGRTASFEGAFMNRSTYQTPTDKGVTIFGFGTTGQEVTIGGNTIDRFFYEKQP
jgi:hypothetical protein